MAVPLLYASSILIERMQDEDFIPFLRKVYVAIMQSQNFREVSHFICRSDFFPPHGLSFGINRCRAGAKVWQRALEIKGRAYGFRKNLHTVG